MRFREVSYVVQQSKINRFESILEMATIFFIESFIYYIWLIMLSVSINNSILSKNGPFCVIEFLLFNIVTCVFPHRADTLFNIHIRVLLMKNLKRKLATTTKSARGHVPVLVFCPSYCLGALFWLIYLFNIPHDTLSPGQGQGPALAVLHFRCTKSSSFYLTSQEILLFLSNLGGYVLLFSYLARNFTTICHSSL